LRTGVILDGVRTLPAEAVLVNAGRHDLDGVLRLTIREGRNRQVRRMCEAVGHPVKSLKRTRIGPLSDRRLRPGEWRDLSADEVVALRKTASAVTRLPRTPRAATSRPRRVNGPPRRA